MHVRHYLSWNEQVVVPLLNGRCRQQFPGNRNPLSVFFESLSLINLFRCQDDIMPRCTLAILQIRAYLLYFSICVQ